MCVPRPGFAYFCILDWIGRGFDRQRPPAEKLSTISRIRVDRVRLPQLERVLADHRTQRRIRGQSAARLVTGSADLASMSRAGQARCRAARRGGARTARTAIAVSFVERAESAWGRAGLGIGGERFVRPSSRAAHGLRSRAHRALGGRRWR